VIVKADRDLRGRIGGVVIFSGSLAYHICYGGPGWLQLDLAAKINSALITVTVIMFLSAYFLRVRPRSYSQGFAETIYPLICSPLPFFIYDSTEVLDYVTPSDPYFGALQFALGIRDELLFPTYISSCFMILGNLITLSGIVCLRESFSIMIEAREPVYTGIYRYIRHPLYVGEGIATVGVMLYQLSVFNVFLTLLFIIGQTVRARFEEKKLISIFPSYREYRENTGAVFPKFWMC
jgi:hypothetical protein